MIECSSENIYYKKRKNSKKNFKLFFSIILVISILSALFMYYKNICSPFIVNICNDKFYSINSRSVNKIILSSLNTNIDYEELISVEKNNNGDIVLLKANSKNINLISRFIIDETFTNIENELKNGIKIPILAFSGIEILSGYGKEVDFKAIAINDVSCNFSSNFASVGINQSLHRIYVEIVSNVKISLPFNSRFEKFSTKILIAETVLVGKVPEIYLNGKLFS